MPFHINYSGIAPIATYFRVKPAVLRDESAKNAVHLSPETDSEMNQTERDTDASASMSDRPGANDAGIAMSIGTSKQPVDNPAMYIQKKLSLGARFVAAFRGRTVHGVTVELPKGYSGIILRAEGDESGKGIAADGHRKQDPSKRQRGRLARKASRVDVDEDVDMDMGERSQGAAEERGLVRTLKPAGTFPSFVLWNPDLPVYEARDEYLRSLTEWTQLAAEASSPLFCMIIAC
jgi:hypothetical protein